MWLWWIMVAFLIALYTLQSLLTKLYTDKYPGDAGMASSVLTAVSGLTVAAVTLAFFSFNAVDGFTFFNFEFNGLCIAIGSLNALALFGYNYFIVKASNSGPYSVVMMFNLSGGIIIPVIAALVMRWDSSWDSTFSKILNTVCIISIIAAVYMVSKRPEEGTARITPSFILSCFGLAVCNGVYGLFLTLQQQTEAAGGEYNRDEMVITTFLVAAVISAVYGLVREKKNYFAAFRQTKASLALLVATSIVFALGINLIVIIIPNFDTTILYTIDNSSVLIMSVLISAVFFKERLSVLNVTGICIMVAALVGMNLLPTLF